MVKPGVVDALAQPHGARRLKRSPRHKRPSVFVLCDAGRQNRQWRFTPINPVKQGAT